MNDGSNLQDFHFTVVAFSTNCTSDSELWSLPGETGDKLHDILVLLGSSWELQLSVNHAIKLVSFHIP
jgi:hypothetical protein